MWARHPAPALARALVFGLVLGFLYSPAAFAASTNPSEPSAKSSSAASVEAAPPFVRSSTAAPVQTAAPPVSGRQSPSFSELLTELLDQNPAVLARKALVRSSQFSKQAAWHQRLPTLTLSGQSRSQQGADALGQVVLEQPLYAGGRIDAFSRLAEAEALAADQELALVRRELALRLVQVVTELHRFERRREVAQTDLQEHQRLADMMQRRVQAGQSPGTEADLVNARLANVQANSLQLQTQLLKLNERLRLLMGRPVQGLPSLTSSAPFARIAAIQPVPEALQGLLREQSPELGRLKADRDQALAEVDRLRADLLPSLSLRWTRQKETTAAALGLDANYENQTVLALSFTPSAGFSSAYRVSAAQERAHAADDLLRATERDLTDRVLSLQEDFKGLGPRIELAQQALASSLQVAQSYARLFAVGRRSWLDTLNAQREVTDLAYQLTDLQTNELALGMQLAIELGHWDLLCPQGCFTR
jgi:outer membrane protein, adhesin transport system